MPVIGVLAEADVGDDAQLGRGALRRGDRALHDAIRRVGARAARVLLFGNAEQDDGRNPEIRDGLRLFGDLIGREPEDAGHRPDRLAHAAAAHGEEREHQVVAREARLAHQSPQRLGAPQPPHPHAGKTHASSPRARAAK